MVLFKNVLSWGPQLYPMLFFNNMHKYLACGSTTTINQVRNYAARKGTREKRKKQKVKIEEKKAGFMPHNERDRETALLQRPKRRTDDSWKKLPIDDVYPHKYYQWKIYEFEEAVKCHRETHHPDIYNQPSANLHLSVELDMHSEKKNRYVDNFTKIVPIKHKFDHGEERTILAFAKNEKIVDEAQKAGAQLAGGPDLIKQIQNGNISIHDFHFILAHPDILPELVVLRGLMKKKFPNIRNGTLEVNLVEGVSNFKTGIQYTAIKDEYEKDFGSIDTIIGTLNMDLKHLEENFLSVIKSVYSFKPKRSGAFITRCLLWSPPSREKLKINHNLYLNESEKNNAAENEEVQQLQREATR